jgi:hypothetical protein
LCTQTQGSLNIHGDIPRLDLAREELIICYLERRGTVNERLSRCDISTLQGRFCLCSKTTRFIASLLGSEGVAALRWCGFSPTRSQ